MTPPPDRSAPPIRAVRIEAKCPMCAKPGTAQYRPFCSKRCADVDLNRWLKGIYAVPVTENDDEDGDKAEDAPAER